MSMLGEYGFRMELYAFNGKFPMSQPHDFTVFHPGGDFEAIGKRCALNGQ